MIAVSNQDRVMALLRAYPGLTDREIRERTGISPHQQVNQISNRLARLGKIRRVKEGGMYRNYPLRQAVGSEPPAPAAPARESSVVATGSALATSSPLPSVTSEDAWHVSPLSDGAALLVLLCSARKQQGGSDLSGPSILDHLPKDLADELAARRTAIAPRARVAPVGLMPAWRRYRGHLYETAGRAFQTLADAGVPTVIVSGGYGVVLADEPIAWYDARFQPGNWPSALVPRCLAAIAAALQVDRVVGLAGATTAYAHVMRQVRWPVEAVLLTPESAGGGAMRGTPQVIGEAVRALARQELGGTWASSEGIGLRKEQLG